MKQGVGTILGTIGEYKPIDLSPIDKAFSSLKKEIEEEDDRYIEQKQKAIDALLKMKTEGLLNTGKNAIQKEIDKAYAEINSGNLVTPSDIQKRVFDIKNDYNVMSAETDRAKEIMSSYLENPEGVQIVELNEETGEIEDVTQDRFNEFFEIFDGEGVYDSEKAKRAMKIASSIGEYSDADYSSMEDSIESYYKMNADKEGRIQGYENYDTFYKYVTEGKLSLNEKKSLKSFIKQTYAPKIALEYARLKKKGVIEDGVTQDMYINTQIEKRIPGIKRTDEVKINKEAAALREEDREDEKERAQIQGEYSFMEPKQNSFLRDKALSISREAYNNEIYNFYGIKTEEDYKNLEEDKKKEIATMLDSFDKSKVLSEKLYNTDGVYAKNIRKGKVNFGGKEYEIRQAFKVPINLQYSWSEADLSPSGDYLGLSDGKGNTIIVPVGEGKNEDVYKNALEQGISFELQTEADTDAASIAAELIKKYGGSQ